MNYESFFQDVTAWMTESNYQLEKHTLFSREYWDWVMQSARKLCDKYDNHPLVMRQVKMLYEYQEELYLKFSQGGS
ncbi:hypothetical protein [Listeria sp. ILCC792]|uniref:hypothetical protein n=1 Tax=Listeria sp. ILCC792 TaxID=1918331 RepID=UPI000B5900A4|nr:hypothetical protein [Listeria sp. ILCC792]